MQEDTYNKWHAIQYNAKREDTKEYCLDFAQFAYNFDTDQRGYLLIAAILHLYECKTKIHMFCLGLYGNVKCICIFSHVFACFPTFKEIYKRYNY